LPTKISKRNILLDFSHIKREEITMPVLLNFQAVLDTLKKASTNDAKLLAKLEKAQQKYNDIKNIVVTDGKGGKQSIEDALNSLLNKHQSLPEDPTTLCSIVDNIHHTLAAESTFKKAKGANSPVHKLEIEAAVTYRTLLAYTRSFAEQNFHNRVYAASIIDAVFTDLTANTDNHGNHFFLQSYLFTQCGDVQFNVGKSGKPEFKSPSDEQRSQLFCHGGRVIFTIDPNINNNVINSMLGIGGYQPNKIQNIETDKPQTDFAFKKVKSEHLTLGSTHYLKHEYDGLIKDGTAQAEGKTKLPVGVWLQQPIYWLSSILPLHKVFSNNHWFGLKMAAYGNTPNKPDGSAGYMNITVRHHDNNILPTLMMTGDEGASWGMTNRMNGHTHSLIADSATLSPAGDLKYNNPFYRYKTDKRAVPEAKYNSVYTKVEPTDVIKFNYAQQVMQDICQHSSYKALPKQQRYEILARILDPKVFNPLTRIGSISKVLNKIEPSTVIANQANKLYHEKLAEIITAAKNDDLAVLSRDHVKDFLSKKISLHNNTLGDAIEKIIQIESAVSTELPLHTQLKWMITPSQLTNVNGKIRSASEAVFTTPVEIKWVYELKNLCQNLYTATMPSMLERLFKSKSIMQELHSNTQKAIACYNNYVCNGYKTSDLKDLLEIYADVARNCQNSTALASSEKPSLLGRFTLFKASKQQNILEPFLEDFYDKFEQLDKLYKKMDEAPANNTPTLAA
jgi:hypothetical protein